MAPGLYTELFFRDEATALSAGHRPCGECRREDFRRYCDAVGRAWERTPGPRLLVAEIDNALHADRLNKDKTKRVYTEWLDKLPDGTMFATVSEPSKARLRWKGNTWTWTTSGYHRDTNPSPDREVQVLTPRTTVEAISAGYIPCVKIPDPSIQGDPPLPQ